MERRQTHRASEWTDGEQGRTTDASESASTENMDGGAEPDVGGADKRPLGVKDD